MLFFALICALSFVSAELDFAKEKDHINWLVKVNADKMTYAHVHTIGVAILPAPGKVGTDFTKADVADQKKITDKATEAASEKVVDELADFVKAADQVTKLEAGTDQEKADRKKDLETWFKDCECPEHKVSAYILNNSAACKDYFAKFTKAAETVMSKENVEVWKKDAFWKTQFTADWYNTKLTLKDQAAIDKFEKGEDKTNKLTTKVFVDALCDNKDWQKIASADPAKLFAAGAKGPDSSVAMYSAASIALLAILF